MGFIFSPLCICALCLSIVILYPKCWGLNSGLCIPDSCSLEHCLSSQHCFLSVKIILGPEELAPAALTEDSSLVPTPTWLLTTTCNCSLRGSGVLLWLVCRYLTYVMHTPPSTTPTEARRGFLMSWRWSYQWFYWELNSHPLQEQYVFFTGERPLLPLRLDFVTIWTISAASAIWLCYHLNHLCSLCH